MGEEDRQSGGVEVDGADASADGNGGSGAGKAGSTVAAGAPSTTRTGGMNVRRPPSAAVGRLGRLSFRSAPRNPLQMLPLILGASGALLFIAFLMTFYNDLFIREWPSGIAYSLLISETLPWLEACALLFALTLATLHLNRNRVLFATLGTLVSAYGIWSTVQFSSLGFGAFEAWAQALFIRIVVPLSIGLLMVAVVPFVEETSRVERTMTSLSSSLTNLESIVASMEELSGKLEGVNSIKEPLKDIGALREQIQSLGEQVRGIRSSAHSYGTAPPATPASAYANATASAQGAGAAAAWSGTGATTMPKMPKAKLVAAPATEAQAPAPQPEGGSAEAGAVDLPDAAKDNPWAGILSDRKSEKQQ